MTSEASPQRARRTMQSRQGDQRMHIIDLSSSSPLPVPIKVKKRKTVDSNTSGGVKSVATFFSKQRDKNASASNQRDGSSFASTSARSKDSVAPVKNKRSKSQALVQWETPWPSAEQQHVYGTSLPRVPLGSEIPRLPTIKGKEKALDVPSDEDAFWSLPTIRLPALEAFATQGPGKCRPQSARQLLHSHEHPLVARILKPYQDQIDNLPEDEDLEPLTNTSEPTRDLWAVKYAPLKVDEVLGSASRESAHILKDWLLEHEIKIRTKGEESKPRRQVTRQIDKTKQRKRKRKQNDSDDDLGDFIVFDDEEETICYDNNANGSSPFRPPHRRPSLSPLKSANAQESLPDAEHRQYIKRPQTIFDHLTNLILLVGPIGTGKTASVYAAAKELGWQVFEVSPGSGKRSPKELLQAVGDVGRNHIVWRKDNASSQKPMNPLAGLFATQAKKSDVSNSNTKEEQTRPITTDKSITQSLILLEEVDILFQDDKSFDAFWEGVEKIVAQSLRPVVLTCNDISRIPFDRLAIQTTLYFDAPEEDEAKAFLQAVTLAEGTLVAEHDIRHALEASAQSPSINDQPSNVASRPPLSLTTQPQNRFDLRKALLQLQFDCASFHRGTWARPDLTRDGANLNSSKSLFDPTKSQRPSPHEALNLMSQVDAFIARNARLHTMSLDGGPTAPESEREIGYKYLEVSERTDFDHCLLVRDTEHAIAAELATAASTYLGPDLADSLVETIEMRLTSDRIHFLQQAEIATSLLDIGDPYVPQEAAVADIVPFISLIVRADDVCEETFRSAVEGGSDGMSLQQHSPSKRRSRRLNHALAVAYQRHLACTDEQLEAARAVAFPLLANDDSASMQD